MHTVLNQRKVTEIAQDIHKRNRTHIQRQFTRVAACAAHRTGRCPEHSAIVIAGAATLVRRLTGLGMPLGEALVTVVRQFRLDVEETAILLRLF